MGDNNTAAGQLLRLAEIVAAVLEEEDAEQTDSMPPSELKEWLLELPAMRATLTKAYSEEMRCMVYFQVLVMADASALVRREKVLFQKFLQPSLLFTFRGVVDQVLQARPRPHHRHIVP